MYYTKSVTQDLTSLKVYLLSGLFVACNVILPQMFHAFGLGGTVFLPILFFTLYAAVRYGATVALLTGVLSPLISHLLTGMPNGVMLSVVIFEGVVLSVISLFVFRNRSEIGFKEIILVVVGYQLAGMIFQWILAANLLTAWDSLFVSLPGMAIQLFAGWLLIRKWDIHKSQLS